MIRLAVQIFCLATIVLAGCTTKTRARADTQNAFQAGQQQGFMQARDLLRTDIRVIGNVKNPVVVWTENLTLAEAIVAAEYRDPKDPRDILVIRQGQVIRFDPQRLLRGEDMLLQPGDTVEIHP